MLSPSEMTVSDRLSVPVSEPRAATASSSNPWTHLSSIPQAVVSEYNRLAEESLPTSEGDKRGRTRVYDAWRDIYDKGGFEQQQEKEKDKSNGKHLMNYITKELCKTCIYRETKA